MKPGNKSKTSKLKEEQQETSMPFLNKEEALSVIREELPAIKDKLNNKEVNK